MREIKFRGKRIDNGEWVYGYYGMIDHEYDQNQHMIISSNGKGSFTVDPNTVGQYTGLKDKNGVEIYEGDKIFVTNDLNSGMEHTIIETEYGFGMLSKYDIISPLQTNFKYDDGRWSSNLTNVFEVIGNIHEEEVQ